MVQTYDEIVGKSQTAVPSYDDLMEQRKSENPFAYGLGRVLMDDGLNQFMAQDMDEDEKYRLANSLYVANTYKIPVETARANYDGIMQEMFKGKTVSPKQVFEKIQWQSMTDKQRFDNYHSNTGAWQEFKDFWSSRWRRGKAMFAGLVEMDTDLNIGTQKKLFGRTFGYAEKLNQWSVAMRDGVKQYMEENPGQFLNVPGDGFWDTTYNYLSHPEVIAAGVAEQVPLMLAATLSSGVGGAVAKAAGAGATAIKATEFISGVQGFAIPLIGERYSNLRTQGIPPIQAIPEAILAGESEGILEEWTRVFNFRLFHGVGSTARKGVGEMVAKWLLSKPYPVRAAAFVGTVYGQGFSEEYLQAVSDNFWEMVFRNPDKDVFDGAMNQAAAGGLLELTMGVLARGTGKVFNKNYITLEEQLARIETLRDTLNSEKAGLNEKQRKEVNEELDNARQDAIDGKWANEKKPEQPPAQTVVQEEKPTEEKPLEPPAQEPPNKYRFGITETKDGWVVMDWETQKELTKPMKQKQALKTMNDYNSGVLEVKGDRRTPLMPSESVTMSVRQLFNLIMKAESKAAREAYLAGAREILGIHKDLGRYAHLALKGLDITKSQRQSLISALTGAKNESERVVALANIHKIRYEAKKAKAISELKELVALVNRRAGLPMQQKGIRSEYLERLKAVTEGILIKPISPAMVRRIESLKEYLKNLKSKELSRYEQAYIESLIPSSLLDKVDKINLKPVSQMGVEELNEMSDTIRRLLKLNDLKNKLILDQVASNVASQLNQAMEEAGELKDRRNTEGPLSAEDQPKKEGPVRALFNFLIGNRNFDMETLSEIISAGNHGAVWDILANGFSDGREVQAGFENHWEDIQRNAMKKAGITLADLQKMSRGFFRFLQNKELRNYLKGQGVRLTTTKEHTVKITGRDVTLTMGEMMSIWMHAQSTDNLSEIMKAGVAFPTHSIGMITMKELEKILSIVESDPKAMALCVMADELHQYSADEINQISRELSGVDLATIEAYWHRQRFTGGGVAGTQAYRNSLLESEGRLQERTGSGNPVIIRDFFETLFADQQAIAEYVGLAKPLRIIKNLLNYKPFRDIVREKGYQNELKMIDTMIERTEQKPHYYSTADTAINGILHGLTRSVLANPSIMAGQYASVLGYFTEADPKYMSVLRVLPDKAFQEKLKQHWNFYRRRAEGGLSSIALSDVLQTDMLLRSFVGKENYLNLMTKGIQAVDMLAITEAGRIVQAEMSDKNLSGSSLEYWNNREIDPSTLEPDSKEYWEEFVKRANYLVRRTQPMFQTENRSIHTSDPSQSSRIWFLFRSYVDQPIRMMHRTYNQYKYGRITSQTMMKKLGMVYAALAMYEVTRFGIDKLMFRTDDDEKDLLLNLLVAPARLMAIVGYPVSKTLKQLAGSAIFGEKFTYREADLMPLPVQFTTDILNVGIKMATVASYLGSNERFQSGPRKGKLKSEEYAKEAIEDTLSIGLRYFGVPAKVIHDMIYGKGQPKKEEKKL